MGLPTRRDRPKFCNMCPHPMTLRETKLGTVWLCSCCDGPGYCEAKEKAKK